MRPPCSSWAVTTAWASTCAGWSRRSGLVPSAASSGFLSRSPRGARPSHDGGGASDMAPASYPRPRRSPGAHRLRRDRRCLDGALQAGAGALGAWDDAGASRGPRSRRRARRGRADHGRSVDPLRRWPAALPHARRGHGDDRHPHDDGGRDLGADPGLAAGAGDAADGRRRRLSGGLPRVGRAHPVPRRGGRQTVGRMVGVDSIRRHDHRRDVAPGGRAGAWPSEKRLTAEPEPGRTSNRPPTNLAVLAALATTILTFALALPAAAHHVGAYTPRDNDLSPT